MSTPRWAAPVTLALAAAGAAVAAYLTLQHYASGVALACPDTGTINCAKVTSSPESVVVGVPVALLGLVWFLALLALLTPAAWASPSGRLRTARLALVSLGVPAVLYLVYTELFTLHAICLWCTAVHVLAIALFAVVAVVSALGSPGD